MNIKEVFGEGAFVYEELELEKVVPGEPFYNCHTNSN